MQKNLGVLITDSVNRDGYLLNFQVLEESISKHATTGMPSLLDHDFHRPLGWIFPFGLLIEPKISKTIGNFLLCENDEDYSQINPKIQEYWNYTNYKQCSPHIEEFKGLLQDNYSESGRFIGKGCVAYNAPGIVSKIFPKIFDNTDKSGLLFLDEVLSDFEYIGDGIFKHRKAEYCIFCHQYFNRNLSLFNNYNTYFIDEFIRLNSNPDITLRIGIDPNVIGLSKTYTGTLEFDYWWGPKFNDDISSLPNEVTRYESNDEQKLFSGVAGTEFWWKSDGHEKTLEIEEIRENPSLGVGSDSYGCRYIHSIYDTDKEEFIHFDGAVRLYSDEQILDRWDVTINKAGKNTDYTKLFRIDGKLGLDEWKKLCILYYKGNPLLFEYFGAMEEYENLKNISRPATALEKYVPNQINNDDGIRMYVSYHNKNTDYKSFERKVINPDVIKFQNGEALSVLEYDIIEIEKYLKRIGQRMEYPGGVKFVKAFDFYTNYPIILHGSEDTENLIENTLKAYKCIFEKQNMHMNKTISFTIGWEMEHFEARISIFGKSSEIVKWLNICPNIPIQHESFKKWLTQQREYIYDNYQLSDKDFSHLLKDDGIFFFKRKTIPQERVSIESLDDQEIVRINTENEEGLDILIQDKIIFPSYFGLLEKITCSKTGLDYLESDTSKYLDDDVVMNIEKIDLLGFFWSDHEIS